MPARIEGSRAHAGGPFLFQPACAVSLAIFQPSSDLAPSGNYCAQHRARILFILFILSILSKHRPEQQPPA